MKNQDTTENTTAVSVGSDALVSLLRTPPRHDYDGYKAAQLMTEAANEIERLRNAIGEARAWFDFNHLDAAWQGKTRLSGDAVRDLRYAYDKLGNVLLANNQISNSGA